VEILAMLKERKRILKPRETGAFGVKEQPPLTMFTPVCIF
jgi:hypothetical protein